MVKQLMLRTGCLILFALVTLSGCSKEKDEGEDPQPDSIVSAAQEQGDLSIFVEALTKTGLDATLEEGTYTVFAPNDVMFQAFLSDLGLTDVDDLINSQGEEQTRQILMYHVLQGAAVRADEFGNAYVATAAENSDGNQLSLYTSRLDTIVALNKNAATIIKSNIDGGNGIIHKINGVLSLPTITLLLNVNPEYNTLVNALRQAEGDLTTNFRQENMSATMFAPGTQAFLDFFNDHAEFSDFNSFVQHFGASEVRDILLYHTLQNNLRAEELSTGSFKTHLDGEELSIVKDSEGTISIVDTNGEVAVVVTGNITAINGTIHKINYVLSPN